MPQAERGAIGVDEGGLGADVDADVLDAAPHRRAPVSSDTNDVVVGVADVAGFDHRAAEELADDPALGRAEREQRVAVVVAHAEQRDLALRGQRPAGDVGAVSGVDNLGQGAQKPGVGVGFDVDFLDVGQRLEAGAGHLDESQCGAVEFACQRTRQPLPALVV
ncbi:MAG TPA: hypothetical protein VLZ05_12825 [Mycobacterium sp.]|nr:hypothetical protein [Mycobacterium sp.]HUH69661.1 hypothetical protein [Mycobacterium sp.]